MKQKQLKMKLTGAFLKFKLRKNSVFTDGVNLEHN